jgi:hypothetical protein
VESKTEFIAQQQPRYATILDTSLNKEPGEKVAKHESECARYRGPFYIDWDARDDIEFAITKANQFLTKLQDLSVDLDSIRFYCSGGRGFHAEIPAELFMEAMPPEGIEKLPRIYCEMVWQLYVDTIDVNVYSTGRGRMWRTPNVQRENGKYKVPITAAELRAMTPESYEEYVKAPRAMPDLMAPVFNKYLAEIFQNAKKKSRAKAEGENRAEAAGRARAPNHLQPATRSTVPKKQTPRRSPKIRGRSRSFRRWPRLR